MFIIGVYEEMNKHTKSSVLIILNMILFCIVLIWAFAVVMASASLDQPLGLVVGLVMIATVVGLSVVFNKVISRQSGKLSVWTKLVLWIVASLAMTVLAVLLFGLAQDTTGVQCVGFFGAQSACTVNWLILIAAIIMNPVYILSFDMVILLLLFLDKAALKQ